MAEPAFPHDEKSDDGSHWHTHPGMTLRDWFAGQALVGIFANQQMTKEARGNRDMAHVAYSAADAMLAERAKP